MVLLLALAVAVLSIAPAATFAQDDGEEVELVWATFWVGTNPLRPWKEVLVEEFNEQYDGVYEVVVEEIPGDAAYADKMRADAVADALPDIITGNVTLMRDLTATGRLVEVGQFLEADPDWRAQFFDNAFDEYIQPDGDLYAISYSLDYVGIYWNTALFADAGIETFPETWDEFFAACEALNEAGTTPFAMDGGWVTLLMWANMIGTQPGGEEWLNSADAADTLVETEAVATGTELLRDYHNQDCTNEDAFTTEYNTAATLFLQGEAAMIANGPWMIPQITGVTAETQEGLSEDVEYANSPGDGVILINGEAAFAVGAKEEEKVEGAIEFIKFLTSPDQMVNQLQLVSRSGPVFLELTEEQLADVDPRPLELIEEAQDLSHVYRHAFLALTPAQTTEWQNFWPEYVRGNLSTEEFLQIVQDANF
jgi:ABC-type glycerol-3-phosphate transport system substrate-binding protein